MFLPFIKRVLDDAPGEVVPWSELHQFVKGGDTISTKACDKLRSMVYRFRDTLLTWGRPPAGEHWILTEKKWGLHLNTSCQWKADKELQQEYGRKSESVFGVWTDPHILEEATPDREQRLPSRSRRHRRRDYDE
jgi:hypothetical protein